MSYTSTDILYLEKYIWICDQYHRNLMSRGLAQQELEQLNSSYQNVSSELRKKSIIGTDADDDSWSMFIEEIRIHELRGKTL